MKKMNADQITAIENLIIEATADDDRFRSMTLPEIRAIALKEKAEVRNPLRACTDWFQGLGCNVPFWTEETEAYSKEWFGTASDDLYWKALGEVLTYTNREYRFTKNECEDFWENFVKPSLGVSGKGTSGIASTKLIAEKIHMDLDVCERALRDCVHWGITERQGGGWVI